MSEETHKQHQLIFTYTEYPTADPDTINYSKAVLDVIDPEGRPSRYATQSLRSFDSEDTTLEDILAMFSPENAYVPKATIENVKRTVKLG